MNHYFKICIFNFQLFIIFLNIMVSLLQYYQYIIIKDFQKFKKNLFLILNDFYLINIVF